MEHSHHTHADTTGHKEISPMITYIKMGSLLILFVLSFLFGIIPIKSRTFYSNQAVLGTANAFSGGVFLAVALIHLIPEAQERFEDYYKSQNDTGEHFPYVLLITIISYTCILFVEKVAFGDSHELLHHHTAVDHEGEQNERRGDFRALEDEGANKEENAHRTHEIRIKSLETVADPEQRYLTNAAEIKDIKDVKISSPITPFLLLIALSLHGFFEGIALGLQNEMKDLINLLVAISLHKWAEGLTLGVSFSKNNVNQKTGMILMALFSLAGPAGIFVGWLISSISLLINGIFMAIASGTFIYIAASEVVVEEFNSPQNKWTKFIFLILGIGFFSLMKVYEEDHD